MISIDRRWLKDKIPRWTKEHSGQIIVSEGEGRFRYEQSRDLEGGYGF